MFSVASKGSSFTLNTCRALLGRSGTGTVYPNMALTPACSTPERKARQTRFELKTPPENFATLIFTYPLGLNSSQSRVTRKGLRRCSRRRRDGSVFRYLRSPLSFLSLVYSTFYVGSYKRNPKTNYNGNDR